jgi:chromosome partitioning protein
MMGSDFFIVPTSPDYYCKQAVTSLARVLPRWNSGVAHFRNPALLYPFPALPPKFCGIISQRYRQRSGNPANIANFNSLIAQSQKYNVQIFSLNDKQLEQDGVILNKMKLSRNKFRICFNSLANSVQIIAGI